MDNLKILFIGDIIGAFGRAIVKKFLPELKEKYAPDMIVANGENSAHGYGITLKIYDELCLMGIDGITMGNHVWDKRDIIQEISRFEKMARPANYPSGAPGNEYIILSTPNGGKLAIVNLIGRVFMPPMDCPFQKIDKLLPAIKAETSNIIVDMNAEASSEKSAMGWYLDGKVSAVVGTHTHVMTADDRILPQGTAFISDVGMAGAYDSIIGMNKDQILKRFTTGMPERFEPTNDGPGILNAVFIEIDLAGKSSKIERIIRIAQ